MPNETDNLLSVSGQPSAVAAFVERARTSHGALDFHAFVPAIDDERDDEDAGHENESDLPIAQVVWGTRWNATNTQLIGDPTNGLVRYFFETSWNPPLPWLASTAQASPDLTFELLYVEPLMAFAGLETYVGGVMTRSFETADPSAIKAYGNRRFDLLRQSLEDPLPVPQTKGPTPEDAATRDVLWDPGFAQLLAEAAARARQAPPTTKDEARYLAVARAYEAMDDGSLAATALRAAGHEIEAVARFVAHAEECGRRGWLHQSAYALLEAGLVDESRAMMLRAFEKGLRPPFTP